MSDYVVPKPTTVRGYSLHRIAEGLTVAADRCSPTSVITWSCALKGQSTPHNALPVMCRRATSWALS